MAAGRIKGITIEIGGDATKLTSALSSVDRAIDTTQRNIRDLDKALKLDPGNTDLLKDKQVELATQIEETKKKLELEKTALDQLKNSDGFDAASEQARNLKTQIDIDTAALKDLEDQARTSSSVLGTQMQVAGDKIATVGDKIKSVGDKISGLGQTMTTKVTMPIVAAFGGSVKAAVDWESAFTGVMKTVDETATTSYDDIAKGIQDMATRTASSANDIAGVAEIAGQLGVGADEILSFTETVVKLGDATDMTAEDAATSLARFANITGASLNDVDKLGSAIVFLGNNFATTEPEITEMSTRLASAGTLAGLSETDILALSAAMSSVGINAEAGGTAMTQTLNAITKAVDGVDNGMEEVTKAQEKVSKASRGLQDAQSALEKKQISYNAAVEKYGEKSTQAQKALVDLETAQRHVDQKSQDLASAQAVLNDVMDGSSSKLEEIARIAGMSADEFSTAWKGDAIGALQAFITGLGNLDEESESTIAVLDNLEMSGIRQSNMLQSLALASDVLGDAVGSAGEAYTENAALEEEASKRYETMAAKMSQLKERFTAVAVEIGNILMPYIEKLMSFIEGLVEKWNSLDDAQKETALKIAAVAAAIGPVLLVVGKLTSGVGSLVTGIGGIVAKVGGAISSMGGLSGAIGALVSPVGIAVAAVAALVGAFVYLYNTNDEFAAHVNEKWEQIKEKASELWEHIKPVFEKIGETFKSLMQTLEPVFAFLVDVISAQIDRVMNLIGPLVDIIGNTISFVMDEFGFIIALLTGDFDGALDHAQGAIDSFLGAWQGVWDLAVAAVENFFSMFGIDIGAVGEKLSAFGEDVKAGWGRLKEDAKEKWDSIKEKVSSVASTVWGTVKEKWDSVKEKTGSTWANMKQVVDQNGGGIKGIISTASSGWKSLIESAWNTADQKTGGALGNMLSAVTEKTGSIRDAIEEKIGAAIDFLKELPGKALQWGKDMIGGFIDGIREKVSGAGDAAGWVAEKVASFLHFSEPDEGPLKDFHTFAPDMVKLFASGITHNLSLIEQASDKMASALVPSAGSIVQNNGAAVSKTVNAPVNITVYGAQGQNVNQLAEIIQQKMNTAVINQEAVFA